MIEETLLQESDIHSPLTGSWDRKDTPEDVIEPAMLAKVRELVRSLGENGVGFCHWKSNIALRESMLGQTDLDLLVHRADAGRFRSILSQLTFSNAFTTATRPFPSVEHYYGLDEESGVLVHVHAYYQVVTGESLTKNYRFPFEDVFLSNTREEYSIPVPTRGAELVVFTLRMMLKHTTPMELFLLSRYWEKVQREIRWLLDPEAIEQALSFVNRWLPEFDLDLFADCVAALSRPAPLVQRIYLGHRLRAQLRPYARQSATKAWLDGLQKFTTLFFLRLATSRKDMTLRDGGVIIAFVGSEATGKSTLVAQIKDWLGEHFSVEMIHVGKPEATILSALPNLLLPIMRIALPEHRSTHVESQNATEVGSAKAQGVYPLLFVIRSTLLAYDRRALLARASRSARNGTIILCDRFPSSHVGAPDSPQLSHLAQSKTRRSVRKWLADYETKMYGEMPAPDLVIRLAAPLDVTLLRNAARGKTEPEEYVRQRYARSASLQYDNVQVCEIDTAEPIDQTILKVKTAIWRLFLNNGRKVRQSNSPAVPEVR